LSSDSASGTRGVVSAGHPLAAAAALDVLRAGGNAVDAVVAGSAVQCVVELPWCGIGGDAFVAVRSAPGEVAVLNGSGRAPRGIEARLPRGASAPRFGPLSVAVPGVVASWGALVERFGTWPLDRLLAAAVRYAVDGFPLDDRLATTLQGLAGGPDHDLFGALTHPNGGDTRAGATFRQPDLGETLAHIAGAGVDSFYRGALAERIADHVQRGGGALDADDLGDHQSTWEAPLAVRYRGATVSTQPPVSMGIVLLAQLAVLGEFDVAALAPGSAEHVDLLVRAKHAAFAELLPRLGDPDLVDVDADALLQPGRWAEAAARIRRGDVPPSATDELVPTGTDTTSIAVTDGDGMAVALVQSLFNEFGARELVDGTGVILNDRLANLVHDPSHPNGLQGGKRPVHTLHSYLVERPDGSVLAGATPGGRGQVQTNLQVLVNALDHGDDLPRAVERPRWVSGTPRRSPPDDTLYMEPGFPSGAPAALEARGHAVTVQPAGDDDHFGCCTVVSVDAAATTHAAAADRRRGAAALGW